MRIYFAHLGSVVGLGLVGIETTERPRRERFERNEELELVREELREVKRQLREAAHLMRGQGSNRARGT